MLVVYLAEEGCSGWNDCSKVWRISGDQVCPGGSRKECLFFVGKRSFLSTPDVYSWLATFPEWFLRYTSIGVWTRVRDTA